MLINVIEDLERLEFKLHLEASLHADHADLAKRLTDLAYETSDVLERAKRLKVAERKSADERPAQTRGGAPG